MKNRFSWRHTICAFGLIGLVMFPSAGANLSAVSAQPPAPAGWEAYLAQCAPGCSPLLNQIAAPEGETLTVSNAGEELNGDTSSPSALIANPGPDGISLVEAVAASEGTVEFDTIRFAPTMAGEIIHFSNTMVVISHGNLLIDGDIDENGTPDVTLDGSSGMIDNGFTIYGASNVLIKGIKIQNFRKDGVLIFTNPNNGLSSLEDIVIYQNFISENLGAIEVNIGSRTNFTMQNIEIVENVIQGNSGGISVLGGMGGTPTDNTISGVTINANQILDNNMPGGENIALFVSPAASYGASRNRITDLEIRGNYINGHPNSVIIDASNQAYCNNNTTDQVLISDNDIITDYVTIEFVNESGMYSSGNTVSNVQIVDNRLTNGGIHFGGASGWAAHDNLTTNVTIERNQIIGGLANGIYMVSASGGAYNNRLENVILRSNYIRNSTDAGILLHATADGSNNSISNVTIVNQTLVNNGLTSTWSAGGININSKNSSNTITGVTISNSILWGNRLNDALGGSLDPDLVTNTLLNDARYLGIHDNFYDSPQFVEPASGDYHLQSTSPCVDAGEPTGTAIGDIDFDHAARIWDGDGDGTSLVDLGAWECGAITMQEMNVRANGVTILDGDAVPAPWDGTDFGAAEVSAAPVEQVFTIENSGAAALNLSGDPVVAIEGAQAGDFAVPVPPPAQVAAGGSVNFTIAFTPQAAGIRQAVVSIASDDADENPYTFAIQGTGTVIPTAPEMDVVGNGVPIASGDNLPGTEDGTEFGSISAGGGMVQHTFTIYNTGDAVLNLSGVAISGGQSDDFWVVEQPAGQVAAGESVSFTVAFTPQAAGLCQTTVRIGNDDADENPYTFAIQGTGTVTPTAPEIDVTGNGVPIASGDNLPGTEDGTEFGSISTGGGMVQHTFTIYNTGDAVLNLSGVAISGGQSDDFWVVAQPAGQVAAGESVSFTVAFTPQASGLRQTTVRIGNDDTDENPYTFAIQGTGTVPPTAPEIDVRGNGVSIPSGDNLPGTEDGTEFGSISAGGGMVQHTFTVHNTGDAALNLTGNPVVAIVGAQAGDFAVLAQPAGQVAAGGSISFTITFTPQAVGLHQAVVIIANNDADENPYTFAIQGTGTVAPPVQLFLPLVLRPGP